MYAIEFKTTVKDGKINLPLDYKDIFNSNVRVILLKEDEHNTKQISVPDTMLLSEMSLAKEWNTKEEDELWANL